jgi:K+-sensing histidine kinase KdpD
MYKQVRRQSVRVISFLDTAIGTLLCTSAAALLAALFAASSVRFSLPLICLAIVLAVAARFGAAAGVLSSLLSALVLAYFVFSPVNSLVVTDTAARNNLGWLLLGGISLSFLFGPSTREVYSRRHGRQRNSRSDHDAKSHR